MNELDLHSSIVDWCIDYPAAVPLFERLGIDYCCGGKSLAYACEQRELDPEAVLAQLQQAIANQQAIDQQAIDQQAIDQQAIDR